jgi:hypothetical protein
MKLLIYIPVCLLCSCYSINYPAFSILATNHNNPNPDLKLLVGITCLPGSAWWLIICAGFCINILSNWTGNKLNNLHPDPGITGINPGSSWLC